MLSKKLLLILTLVVLVSGIGFGSVKAVNLTTALLRFNRMKINTPNVTILVALKPSSTTTTNKLRVVLDPNSYSIDSVAGNLLASTINVLSETLAGTSLCANSVPISVAAASAVSASTIDFTMTSTALSTSSIYCFYITKGVGNANTQATASLQDRIEEYNSTTLNETSRVATATIADDQVVVTAVVPSIFTFTLSANSVSFLTDLTTSRTTSTTAVTVTVGTNAQAGWVSWLQSTNGALTSASAAQSIPTTGIPGGAPITMANGISDYLIHVANGTGTTVDPSVDGSSSVNKGGAVSSYAMQRIAYQTSGPTSGDSFTVVGRANISSLQKAATDYTDTWTIIGAGQF